MPSLLELLKDQPAVQFATGENVIEQGSRSGTLLVLIDGSLEVLRDEVRVARVSEPGAIFGELSILLGGDHTATLRALTPCSFHVIDEPLARLRASAELSLHVAELLAHRLDALNKYLVDVKRQYEGHDHLGMVDEVLDALMRRHPRKPKG